MANDEDSWVVGIEHAGNLARGRQTFGVASRTTFDLNVEATCRKSLVDGIACKMKVYD